VEHCRYILSRYRDAIFNKSILSLDVATLASTRARSRRGIVFRDRPPSVSLSLILSFMYLLKDETAMSYIYDAWLPPCSLPLFSISFWSWLYLVDISHRSRSKLIIAPVRSANKKSRDRARSKIYGRLNHV